MKKQHQIELIYFWDCSSIDLIINKLLNEVNVEHYPLRSASSNNIEHINQLCHGGCRPHYMIVKMIKKQLEIQNYYHDRILNGRKWIK